MALKNIDISMILLIETISTGLLKFPLMSIVQLDLTDVHKYIVLFYKAKVLYFFIIQFYIVSKCKYISKLKLKLL